LKEQAVTKPAASFTNEGNLTDLIKDFKEEIKPTFEEDLSIFNPIVEFTMGSAVSIDSKIVKQSS